MPVTELVCKKGDEVIFCGGEDSFTSGNTYKVQSVFPNENFTVIDDRNTLRTIKPNTTEFQLVKD